jgi:hypothetical protein
MRFQMEIIIGVLAFLIGGGAGFGIAKATQKKEEPIVIEDKTSEEQQLIIKQLTNLDLIIPLCSPIKEEGKEVVWESDDQELMCRYLACLQFSRGIDSQTGGNGECEKISNVLNKKAILKICKKEESPELQKSCIELFDRRL